MGVEHIPLGMHTNTWCRYDKDPCDHCKFVSWIAQMAAFEVGIIIAECFHDQKGESICVTIEAESKGCSINKEFKKIFDSMLRTVLGSGLDEVNVFGQVVSVEEQYVPYRAEVKE